MKIVTSLLIAFYIIGAHQELAANESRQRELEKEMLTMDTLLFEKTFNQCDLSVLDDILDDDFEFYHDEGGVDGRDDFMAAIKNNICSSKDKKPIRKLVDGSMQVYRLQDNGQTYGALQRGIHEFFIKEPGKELYRTNIAQFTHLWLRQGEQWKLKRVLSFDHKEPPIYLKNIEMDKKFNAKAPIPVFDKDDYIESILAKHNIPSVSIGVISQGKLQQIRTFGNQPLGSTPSYNDIYKVASLTKPIAALVVLKLVNKGEITLDEPVANYYMDSDIINQPMAKSITFRHVLSHQSGLPNWRYLHPNNKLVIEFKPGSRYQYSGEGYELMRKAIEVKLNKSFEEIAQELLFDPLTMSNTAFYWNENIPEEKYRQESDEKGKPIAFSKYDTASAAANLLTTASDYGVFMSHIIGGAGLSEELFKEMVTPQVMKSDVEGFGLGWQIFPDLEQSNSLGSYALQHTGGDYGTKTLAIMFPEAKKGLVVLTNSENGMVIWGKLLREYFGPAGEEVIKRNLIK